MLALLLVAASLGLSNFAASVSIGVSGIDARTRLRVGIIFGIFETGMPIVGLLLGRGLATTLGHAAHWIGAGLLIATGLYTLVQAFRGSGGQDRDDQPTAAGQSTGGQSTAGQSTAGQSTGRMLITGLALSVDNLAVGFALGTYHVNLVVAAIVIGAVSVALSLLGLELGRQIGARAGIAGEFVGGGVLVGVGIAIATGVI